MVAARRAKMPDCVELISDGSQFSLEEKAAWKATPQRPGARTGGLTDPDVAWTVNEGILARGRYLREASVDSQTSSSSEDSVGVPAKPAAAVAPLGAQNTVRSPEPVGLMVTVSVVRRPEPPPVPPKPAGLRAPSDVSRLPESLEIRKPDTPPVSPSESPSESAELRIESMAPYARKESASPLAPAGGPGMPRVLSAGITPRASVVTTEAPAAVPDVIRRTRPAPVAPAHEAPALARVQLRQPRQPVAAKPAQGTHAAPWIRSHVLDRLDHLMQRLPVVSAPKLHAPTSPLRYLRGF